MLSVLAFSENNNEKPLKMELLKDDQNDVLLNEKDIKISISLYEVPYPVETANDPFFTYLTRNSAPNIRNVCLSYLSLLLCTIIMFFFFKI